MQFIRLKPKSMFYLLLFLAFLTLLSSPALADEAGVFTKVQGRVDILRTGASSVAPAKINDVVSTGDIVRTKSDGRAIIVFKDDTTLNIAPESRISIDEYMFVDGTRKNAALSLFRGKIRAIVSKGGLGVTPVAAGRSDFSVRTPTGVMGVKGTDFFMFFTSGITGVIFREGSGFLFNPAMPDKIVSLAAGFMTQILKESSPPLLPRRATDAEINTHLRHTTIEDAKKEDSDEKPPVDEAMAGETENNGAEAPEEVTGAEAGEEGSEYEETIIAGLSAKGLDFDDAGGDLEDADAQSDFGGDEGIEEETKTESEVETDLPYTETEEDAIDSEAPVFSLVPSTNSVTNSPDAVFSLTASENATYSYRLDNGAWVSTGPDIYLTGLSEGLHYLDVASTDSAGNTSTTTYTWFYGARHFNLYGAIEGPGISGEGTGDLALLSYDYTGAWALDLSGTASNEGAFSAKAGGSAYFDSGYVSGYWNESLDGSIGDGVISGSSDFTYLSLYSLIRGAGYFSGTAGNIGLELDKQEEGEGDGGISWQMTDAGMGTLTEEPLSFLSSIYAEAYNFYGELAYFHSLLGGTDSLWTATQSDPAEAVWVGEFSMPDYGPFLLQYGSYNYLNYTGTTYDNGAYWGFMTGAYTLNGLDSNLFFLYIDPEQGAGIILGSLESAGDSGAFIGQGEFFPVEITSNIGISPYDLSDYVLQRDFNTAAGDFRLNSQNLGSSYGRNFTVFNQFLTIGNSDWGVWNSRIRGSYAGTSTTDDWGWQYEYNSSAYSTGFKTDGSKWSDGLIEGSTVGYVADPSTAMSWILGGEVIGTFDPTTYTYDVVQAGAHLEVRRFLAMTGNASGQSALSALNIPYAEVGRTNLTGSDGNLSVNMNDVVFFAYSTGASPQIWATQSVSGTYAASPSTNTVVSISNGTGLNADFTTQSWADSKWSASISGSGTYSGAGTMNGSSVQFTGAATGPYGSGSFSGTGAGIAR